MEAPVTVNGPGAGKAIRDSKVSILNSIVSGLFTILLFDLVEYADFFSSAVLNSFFLSAAH